MAPVKQGVGVFDQPDVLRFVSWQRREWEYVAALAESRRQWRTAFLIVCVQFAVVTVAAVWGWAR